MGCDKMVCIGRCVLLMSCVVFRVIAVQQDEKSNKLTQKDVLVINPENSTSIRHIRVLGQDEDIVLDIATIDRIEIPSDTKPSGQEDSHQLPQPADVDHTHVHRLHRTHRKHHKHQHHHSHNHEHNLRGDIDSNSQAWKPSDEGPKRGDLVNHHPRLQKLLEEYRRYFLQMHNKGLLGITFSDFLRLQHGDVDNHEDDTNNDSDTDHQEVINSGNNSEFIWSDEKEPHHRQHHRSKKHRGRKHHYHRRRQNGTTSTSDISSETVHDIPNHSPHRRKWIRAKKQINRLIMKLQDSPLMTSKSKLDNLSRKLQKMASAGNDPKGMYKKLNSYLNRIKTESNADEHYRNVLSLLEEYGE